MTGATQSVEVVADLLQAFDPANVAESSSCQVRIPASSGNVKRDGLYQHPRIPGRPAVVTYRLQLPKADPGALLLFAFDTAMADGARLSEGADGVRFEVRVNDGSLYSRECGSQGWQPGAVDLTPFHGQPVDLALVVDAKANTAWDWALWGNPRILHFSPGTVAQTNRSEATPGALAVVFDAGKEQEVRLIPDDGSEPVVLRNPGAGSARQWIVADFSFPNATRVKLDWTPREAPAFEQIRLGAYPARLRINRVSTSSAVPKAGEPAMLRVEVRNDGRGGLKPGEAKVELHVAGSTLEARELPAMGPSSVWQGEWIWTAPEQPGVWNVAATLAFSDGHTNSLLHHSFRTYAARPGTSISNDHLRIEFHDLNTASGHARLFARRAGEWLHVGVWSPLTRIVLHSTNGPVSWDVPLEEITASADGDGRTFEFQQRRAKDPDGVAWDVRLRIELDESRPIARLKWTWQPAADRAVLKLQGPNVYVGDGTTGAAKSWGLFPGLEYLYGPEPSSNLRDFSPPLNDRRSPHPYKVTVPMMAVTVGPRSPRPPLNPSRFYAPDSFKDQEGVPVPASRYAVQSDETTVALFWDPLQPLADTHTFPTPRFSSPNRDEGMDNHRLSLSWPSVPLYVPENAELATKPVSISAGQAVTLETTLAITPGPVLTGFKEWLLETGGLPATGPWPRSFQEELDLCREGFLNTVWDGKAERWRHCIDWPAGHAPGFAALLWWDSQVAGAPQERRRSRERVELAAAHQLPDDGASGFSSPANCHIMHGEFPFLYGHLPRALGGMADRIRQIREEQQPGGGWIYKPGAPEQSDLGQAGDSVLGTCAQRAATLLRYARITGDEDAGRAGLKALEFMRRFHLPRGGQTWECPMYEPDILAAAHAIRAYVEGFRITGDPRWLEEGVYWAETGVPFIYLWSLPDKPLMAGAVIPVFGSTFYSHSWLATPVQWCGLVYAYHAWHLASELDRYRERMDSRDVPSILGFSTADWRRLAELITISAMHQQFAEGPRIGTYPDSVTDFEIPNPAFLNPEDILVNVLTLKGYDPDIRTERATRNGGSFHDPRIAQGDSEPKPLISSTPSGGEGRGGRFRESLVVSSPAWIRNLRFSNETATFDLDFFEGETSYSLVGGIRPRRVRVNGRVMERSEAPIQRQPGWSWDSSAKRLYLAVPHPAGGRASVEIELEGD